LGVGVGMDWVAWRQEMPLRFGACAAAAVRACAVRVPSFACRGGVRVVDWAKTGQFSGPYLFLRACLKQALAWWRCRVGPRARDQADGLTHTGPYSMFRIQGGCWAAGPVDLAVGTARGEKQNVSLAMYM
jgi:hypothetical protein